MVNSSRASSSKGGARLRSSTRVPVGAVGVVLRRAYTAAFGRGLLDPEGEFPGQQDPAFARDLMGPKTSHGSDRVRPMSGRMPFLNYLLGAL